MFRTICLPLLLTLGGLMMIKYGMAYISTALMVIGVVVFGMGMFGGIMPFVGYMTDDEYAEYDEEHNLLF